MKNCHILFFLAALGCAATASAQDFFARKSGNTAAAAEAPRENARAELLLQQMERLSEQVNTLRQDYAQLEQRATQADAQAKTIARLQDENTKLRDEINNIKKLNDLFVDNIKKLGDELVAVKNDRETLRKQITDDLTAKITAAIEKNNAARPAPQGGGSPAKNTGKETGRLHVVEAGQTLSEIAAAYKTKIDVIVKANNMKDANSLRVGQELFIPDP